MRRFILTTLLIITTALAFAANPAGDFEYEKNADGTGIIVKCYTGAVTDAPKDDGTIGFGSSRPNRRAQMGKTIEIPDMIDDLPVVQLGVSGSDWSNDGRVCQFFENPVSYTVVVPASVKIVENNTFKSSECGVNLIAPQNLTFIGENAFAHIAVNRVITFSKGCQICSGAFQNAHIAEIIFADGFETLGNSPSDKYTFGKMDSLVKITFPATLKTVNGSAFYGSMNISEVVIAKGAKIKFNSKGTETAFSSSVGDNMTFKTKAALRKAGYLERLGSDSIF